MQLRSVRKELWKNKVFYLMAVPLLVLLFLFAYLPMPGLIIAFKNYNFRDGIWGSPWVAFENFKFFFTSNSFKSTTFNTLWINFNNLFWSTLLAVVFSVVLNEIRNVRMKKAYQTFMFIPYFFSAVIVGRFVLMIFGNNNGLVNQVIQTFGGESVPWYNEPQHWVKILVGTNLWKNIGYSMVIYIASISSLDSQLFEAASIDGADRFKRIWHILLPGLLPTIITMTLLSIGRMFFGDFQLIYAITGGRGQLLPTTDIIETFVYRSVMAVGGSPDYGFSAAVGLYQAAIGAVLVLGSNLLVKKYNSDYALF